MYRVMLLKVGTQVHVTGHGWGCVGRITRVFPSAGAYHVENARFAVRPGQHTIETFTDRRGQ
jgi:phosphoribosylaminoimidazole (AIR) synthetase